MTEIPTSCAPSSRARASLSLTGLLVSLLLAAGSSCSSSSEEGLRDVLLVTVDTLRSDHVGIYGYERDTTPNLDRRFRDGAVYLRSYAAESSTSPSVVSILSGLIPQEHRVRMLYQLLPETTELVTDHLPRAYTSAAFVSNIVLTDEALGIADRFDHYDDFVDEKEPRRAIYERNAKRTTDAAVKWLREQLDPDRPLFLWVHYIDPHGPYMPPLDSKHSFQSDERIPIDIRRVPSYTRALGQTDGNYYVDRYDEEIAYTDEQIERLFAAYEGLRSFDDALVIFSADHGESMMEHERWFTHSYHVYDEIGRVPLLVRGPGVEAGAFEAPASGIDIAPTILRFVGAPVPDSMPDVDLLRPRTLPEDRVVFLEAAQPRYQYRAAIQGAQKWVVQVGTKDGQPGQKWGYDLGRDPGELAPRPWDAHPPPDALMQLVAADPDPGGLPPEYAEGVRIGAPKVAPGLDEETMRQLEALGYAGLDEEEYEEAALSEEEAQE